MPREHVKGLQQSSENVRHAFHDINCAARTHEAFCHVKICKTSDIVFYRANCTARHIKFLEERGNERYRVSMQRRVASVPECRQTAIYSQAASPSPRAETVELQWNKSLLGLLIFQVNNSRSCTRSLDHTISPDFGIYYVLLRCPGMPKE